MATLTLEQVRNMLGCNKHRLDDELEIQPEIMQRIATQVVMMNSRMLEAKDDLACVEGRLTIEAKEDDPKMTVDAVAATVKRHSDRTRAWQKYQQARADYEEWDHMLNAWRQKGFSLNKLCELYEAQYFSVDSVSAPRSRNRDEGRLVDRQAEMRAVRDRGNFVSGDSNDSDAAPRRRVAMA